MSKTTIRKEFNVYVLELQFKHQGFQIICWLPLKNSEPPNKKKKIGNKLSLREAQESRGKYYQMNEGKSTHVYFCEQKWGAPTGHSKWKYHVSHLCHHWWCCNPDHLVHEPEWVNHLRKGCNAIARGGSCNCNLAYHPDLNQNLSKCVWYTAGTLEKEKINDLDLEFLNAEKDIKERFINWDDVLKAIKML